MEPKSSKRPKRGNARRQEILRVPLFYCISILPFSPIDLFSMFKSKDSDIIKHPNCFPYFINCELYKFDQRSVVLRTLKKLSNMAL